MIFIEHLLVYTQPDYNIDFWLRVNELFCRDLNIQLL